MRKLLKSRKALSPVVAAIILIAVTVAVSIAVAAWMGALTFTFMGYEKLEIKTITWTWGTPGTITITVENTGTKDVTINRIEVNHVKVPDANVTAPAAGLPYPFKTTDSALTITFTYAYSNGTSYDIAVVTQGGYEFTDNFTGGQDES